MLCFLLLAISISFSDIWLILCAPAFWISDVISSMIELLSSCSFVKILYASHLSSNFLLILSNSSSKRAFSFSKSVLISTRIVTFFMAAFKASDSLLKMPESISWFLLSSFKLCFVNVRSASSLFESFVSLSISASSFSTTVWSLSPTVDTTPETNCAENDSIVFEASFSEVICSLRVSLFFSNLLSFFSLPKASTVSSSSIFVLRKLSWSKFPLCVCSLSLSVVSTSLSSVSLYRFSNTFLACSVWLSCVVNSIL
mmetsp:Transcript_21426/g.44633  ORF Transcript_21426/g.44633 Transcript_21426/m.44633 type:complete len:256 (+) Transcript_21426:1458-2225(+)